MKYDRNDRNDKDDKQDSRETPQYIAKKEYERCIECMQKSDRKSFDECLSSKGCNIDCIRAHLDSLEYSKERARQEAHRIEYVKAHMFNIRQ